MLRRKRLCSVAALAILGMAAEEEREKEKKKSRRLWSRQWLARRNEGEGRGVLSLLKNELRLEDTVSFSNFVRMDKVLFDELVETLRPFITKQDTVMREAITPEARLALTLRFLATGESFRSLQYACRIASNTVSLIVNETLHAIKNTLADQFIKMPQSAAEWVSIADGFQMLWQFPHCIGALDGKHIVFRPSRSDGSIFRNYKGTDSIVLLALVDSRYRFLYIDVGRNGRCNDAGVFRESTLSQSLSINALDLPAASCLPRGNLPVPYVIVADDAFPLHRNIMKPFPDRNLTQSKRIFNYRLSRARRVVENAFGIMSNKFRVLLTPINLGPEKVDLITTVCCSLHNFIIERKGTNYGPSSNQNDESDPQRMVSHLQGLQNRQSSNNPCRDALTIRMELERYFIEDGAVPWQEEMIANHRW